MGLVSMKSDASAGLQPTPYGMVRAIFGKKGLLHLLGLGIIVISAALLQLTQPMLLSRMIDPEAPQRVGAAGVFVVAVIFQVLLAIIGQVLQQLLQLRRSTELREEIFLKLHGSQVGASLETAKSLYPVVSVVEIPNAVNGIVRPIIQGARDLTLIGGVAAYFLSLSGPLMLVAISMLFLGCFSIILGLGPIKNDGATAVAANQHFSRIQYEYISHYDEVRSRLDYGKHASLSGVMQSIGDFFSCSKQLLFTKSKHGALAEFFFGLTAPAMACLAAIVLYPRGDLQLNQILEVFLYASMIVGPVQSAAAASFDWQYTSTLVNRILQLQNLTQESDNHLEETDVESHEYIRTVRLGKQDTSQGDELLSSTSFEIPSSGIFVISGHSGTGKTTLGRILAGLDVASSGYVCDKSGVELKPQALRTRFSYAAQNPGYAEGLFESATTDALNNAELAATIISALELDHLIPRLQNRSFLGSDFSGGEAKRLSIFGAIAQDKIGVILDEPTNGLNDQLVEKFLCYLNKYRNERVWVLITHDKRIKDTADRLVELPMHE